MRLLMLTVLRRTLPLAALVATVGCGSSGPEVYPVSGIVLYEDVPVEGATVTFSSTSDSTSASGTTDSEGRYILSTFERHDGAPPGEYQVRVFKYDSSASQTQVADGGDGDLDENYEPPSNAEIPVAPPKHLLPEIYSDASRTPLAFTVERASDNVFDIPLSDSP